MREFVPGL
jgi:hypothetical protein